MVVSVWFFWPTGVQPVDISDAIENSIVLGQMLFFMYSHLAICLIQTNTTNYFVCVFLSFKSNNNNNNMKK